MMILIETDPKPKQQIGILNQSPNDRIIPPYKIEKLKIFITTKEVKHHGIPLFYELFNDSSEE